MTLDHELGAFKVVSLEVVDEDSSIRVVMGHLGCVLPRKQVLGAFGGANRDIQWAQGATIEPSIDESWRILFVLALAGEAGMDGVFGGSEVIVAVEFD